MKGIYTTISSGCHVAKPPSTLGKVPTRQPSRQTIWLGLFAHWSESLRWAVDQIKGEATIGRRRYDILVVGRMALRASRDGPLPHAGSEWSGGCPSEVGQNRLIQIRVDDEQPGSSFLENLAVGGHGVHGIPYRQKRPRGRGRRREFSAPAPFEECPRRLDRKLPDGLDTTQPPL